MTAAPALFESSLASLTLMNRGKVRDIYAIDDDHMLIVASDRLSAFDVVMSDPIPDKGRVLTSVSKFWFARSGHIVANHSSDLALEDVLPDRDERKTVEQQAMGLVGKEIAHSQQVPIGGRLCLSTPCQHQPGGRRQTGDESASRESAMFFTHVHIRWSWPAAAS